MFKIEMDSFNIEEFNNHLIFFFYRISQKFDLDFHTQTKGLNKSRSVNFYYDEKRFVNILIKIVFLNLVEMIVFIDTIIHKLYISLYFLFTNDFLIISNQRLKRVI